MSFETILKGLVRSGPRSGDEGRVQLSERGELLVVGGGLPYTEVTRLNETYNVISDAGTPLVVIPTTLCILELFNNTEDRVLEVQDLFLFHLLGTAALHAPSIWAMVTAPKAAPTVAALSIGSQSGRPPATAVTNGDVVPGAGTTVIANGWRPWGAAGNQIVGTATPVEAFSVPVDGKLLVPPRCSLAITATDTLATASSVQVGAAWSQRKLAIG